MGEFDEWFGEVKREVRRSSDWSGDSKTLEGKIQQLQVKQRNVIEMKIQYQSICVLMCNKMKWCPNHLTQEILDSIGDGQSKLEAATEEGERLYYCLPKPVVLSIQERIAKAEKEFHSFKKQCLKDKQALEDCISELGRWELALVYVWICSSIAVWKLLQLLQFRNRGVKYQSISGKNENESGTLKHLITRSGTAEQMLLQLRTSAHCHYASINITNNTAI